ncbi:MAG: DNA repair protein RadC [Candidatus Marinimicrobia bacterium]|nr:DNA repair protein RadC [Candidatus Neomarinimicrobiota bacterium]
MDKKSDHRLGHRQRLKERYLKSGLNGLSEYEIIELLLTLGTPRKDVKEPAKNLLKKFKTLRGVLDADETEMKSIKGVGPNNLFGLKFIHDVASEYLKQKSAERPVTSSPEALYDYLKHSMSGLDKEVFKAVYLDAKNKIIEVVDLFEGTVDTSVVYLRETIKNALNHNAVSIIFAHNHLSGDTKPSQDDKKITQELLNACELMELRVLDHIIISDGSYYSFANHGLIETYRSKYEKFIKSI